MASLWYTKRTWRTLSPCYVPVGKMSCLFEITSQSLVRIVGCRPHPSPPSSDQHLYEHIDHLVSALPATLPVDMANRLLTAVSICTGLGDQRGVGQLTRKCRHATALLSGHYSRRRSPIIGYDTLPLAAPWGHPQR